MRIPALTASLTGLLTAAVAFAAEAEHGEAEAAATPFAGTIYQSIAAIIVFVLLLVVLRKYAWGPILKGLQDREAKIRADLENAERAAREADATLKRYQQQLAAAREEQARLIETGRRDAEREAGRIQEEAKREIDAMRKRAVGEIQFAKEEAIREVFAQAATLATDVATKILQREIRPDDQRRLVQEALAGVRREDLS
jgi:F-type H+-transporting ATPase subunit b